MLKAEKLRKQKKIQRASRVRTKLRAAANGKLRLTVFASNKYFYAQIVDDAKGATVLSAHENELKAEKGATKTKRAEDLGKLMAGKAKEKKIGSVVFDKGSKRYHGRVKAFADSARKEGMQF